MFKTDLIVKRNIKTDNSWTLSAPLVWEDDRFIITVYEGLEFDFASVPVFLQWYIPKVGLKYDRASTLHDCLYGSRIFDRKTCDKLFYYAMIADGVDSNTALEMYLAVRLGGQSAYDDGSASEYRDFVKVELKDASKQYPA